MVEQSEKMCQDCQQPLLILLDTKQAAIDARNSVKSLKDGNGNNIMNMKDGDDD